jgi:hypothetical protein
MSSGASPSKEHMENTYVYLETPEDLFLILSAKSGNVDPEVIGDQRSW